MRSIIWKDVKISSPKAAPQQSFTPFLHWMVDGQFKRSSRGSGFDVLQSLQVS